MAMTRFCTGMESVSAKVCPTTTHSMEMARMPSTQSSAPGAPGPTVSRRRVFEYREKLRYSARDDDGSGTDRMTQACCINQYYRLTI